jgi:hypothetical protein
MCDRTFQLYFVGVSTAELFQTHLSKGSESPPRITVRGKTSGAYTNAGSFHFSSAVRALCLLCLKTVIMEKSRSYELPVLIGERGSLAASLDYALAKQPMWIQEMFGSDVNGAALAPRLFRRTNSHRKRPGPVVIKVNERALPPQNIHIHWNGRKIDDIVALETLLSLLVASEDTEEPETSLTGSMGKLAA